MLTGQAVIHSCKVQTGLPLHIRQLRFVFSTNPKCLAAAFALTFPMNRKVLTTSQETNKRIDSPRSKGCHDLIKKGAKLCEGVEDVLSEFEYLFPMSNKPPTPGDTGVLPALELSENEQLVFDAVRPNDEATIDEVIRRSGLPASAASVALLSLEMKRVIKQLPGKLFVRNR